MLFEFIGIFRLHFDDDFVFARIIEFLQIKSGAAVPTASRNHYHAFALLRFRLRIGVIKIGDHLRIYAGVVKLDGFFVQKTMIAGERNGVFRADGKRKTRKFVNVLLRRAKFGKFFLVILNRVWNRCRARMTAETKINFRKTIGDLFQRQTESFAVVGVQKRCFAVAQNGDRIGGKKPELERMQKTIFPNLEFIAVSDFDYVVEFTRFQVAHHSRSRNFRHEISHVAVEQTQRRRVKMIPVQMGQINKIRLNILDFGAVNFGKIPPTAPVTRTDEPRIEQERFAFIFNRHSGVTENFELHIEKLYLIKFRFSNFRLYFAVSIIAGIFVIFWISLRRKAVSNFPCLL